MAADKIAFSDDLCHTRYPDALKGFRFSCKSVSGRTYHMTCTPHWSVLRPIYSASKKFRFFVYSNRRSNKYWFSMQSLGFISTNKGPRLFEQTVISWNYTFVEHILLCIPEVGNVVLIWPKVFAFFFFCLVDVIAQQLIFPFFCFFFFYYYFSSSGSLRGKWNLLMLLAKNHNESVLSPYKYCCRIDYSCNHYHCL